MIITHETVVSLQVMRQLKTLSALTPTLEQEMYKVHHLARSVFEPPSEYNDKPTTARQLKLDNWTRRLQYPDACIIYAVDFDEQPTAFFFIHPRPMPDEEAGRCTRTQQVASYHIYLAAVRADKRGTGLFKTLLEATKQKARDCGYPYITVSTIPKRFPRMYEILSHPTSGWELMEQRTIKTHAEESDLKVVMMRPSDVD